MTSNIDRNGTANGGRTIDIVAGLRRQWYVPVICALVAALLGFGYTRLADESYVSTATVLLERMHNENAPGGGLGRTLDVESQATLAALDEPVADDREPARLHHAGGPSRDHRDVRGDGRRGAAHVPRRQSAGRG